MRLVILFWMFMTLTSCSYFGGKDKAKEIDNRSDVEKLIKKKKRKNTSVNVKERTLDDESSGIVFGGSEIDPLGKQNVMWRATMKAFDFIPINTADYAGGLIVTDWYSPETSNESIKINVTFNSNEVKVSSFDVKAFKKKCNAQQACKVSSMGKVFNNQIKSQILEEIKNIEIDSSGYKG